MSKPWVHTLKERQDSIPREISAFYRLPRSPRIWQLTEKTVTTDKYSRKVGLFFFDWNGRKWTYFNFSRFSIMAAMTMWLLLKERCLHHTHSLPLVSPFVLKYETSHFCNCMINYKSPPLEVTFSRRESLWSIIFLSLEVVFSNNIKPFYLLVISAWVIRHNVIQWLK